MQEKDRLEQLDQTKDGGSKKSDIHVEFANYAEVETEKMSKEHDTEDLGK